MFNLFNNRRKIIRANANRMLNSSVFASNLFTFGDLGEAFENEAGANMSACDTTDWPILLSVLLLMYVIKNIARAEIGIAGTTEKDFKILVSVIEEEMKVHPKLGEKALFYWNDLLDTEEQIVGPGVKVVASNEALAKFYGFWLLKNVKYANADINSRPSLLLGTKVLDNLRRLSGVNLLNKSSPSSSL